MTEDESAGVSAVAEITAVPTKHEAILVRLEQAYLVAVPHGGSLARRVDRGQGGQEIALFSGDGREVVALELVREAFFEIDSGKVRPVFREETWEIAPPTAHKARVVRTIDAQGRREVVSITECAEGKPELTLTPLPALRRYWDELIGPVQRDA